MPLRLFASGTRTAANVSRGLMYAGMYGMFFFVGQFLQDVQGYSPLRTGLSFLPVPISVFLSSQLVSRVLIGRVRPKALIMTGISLTVVALFLSSQLHAGATYGQILVSLVLLGFGSGTALVPLTTAGLAGVDPGDAGAASGLVNVTQQLGAALGLAVLVTVLSGAAGHAQLKAGAAVPSGLVHGLDLTFGVAAFFGIAALVMVALLVHLPADDAAAQAGTAGREESPRWRPPSTSSSTARASNGPTRSSWPRYRAGADPAATRTAGADPPGSGPWRAPGVVAQEASDGRSAAPSASGAGGSATGCPGCTSISTPPTSAARTKIPATHQLAVA